MSLTRRQHKLVPAWAQVILSAIGIYILGDWKLVIGVGFLLWGNNVGNLEYK